MLLETNMLRGILLGVVLTIAGAYISDSIAVRDPHRGRTMVNWEVVGANLQGLASRLQDEWNKRVS